LWVLRGLNELAGVWVGGGDAAWQGVFDMLKTHLYMFGSQPQVIREEALHLIAKVSSRVTWIGMSRAFPSSILADV
jgi:hypothetical protein